MGLAKSAKKKKKSPKKKKAKKAKKTQKKKKKKPAKASRVKGTKNYKKGAHKSAKSKAKGKGLFAAKSLSPALAGIVGKKSASRIDVTKAVWKYIKSKKLNKGRKISPDGKLAAATKAGSFDMFKLPGLLG